MIKTILRMLLSPAMDEKIHHTKELGAIGLLKK